MKKFLKRIHDSVENYRPQYTFFGIFGLVNFGLPYFLWDRSDTVTPLFLWLRVIACGLCFVLIMRDFWAPKIDKYLPFLWLLTIGYCLPFFCFYKILKSQASLIWMINLSLSMFLLAFLTTWRYFMSLIVLGSLGAIFLDMTTLEGSLSFLNKDRTYLSFYIYFYSFAICLFFLRDRERLFKSRIQGMKALAGKMGHELRTPLSAIGLTVSSLKKSLERNTPKETLEALCERLESLTEKSQTIINIMIAKIKENHFDRKKYKPFETESLLNEVMKNYPFAPGEEDRIQVKVHKNFTITGDHILFMHVIFNLLKNALYSIHRKGSGGIVIHSMEQEGMNKIVVQDTGLGIPKDQVAHIFNQFYTKTPNGTGLGLTFCKMIVEEFGGEISCHSDESATSFSMTFPKRMNHD